MKLTPAMRTLDRWFGRYIRLRDTPGPCCTCGKWLTFEDADPGHFITRDRIAVRWDEQNCHAQCRRCNYHGKGEQFKHSLHVAKVHGEQVPDLLLWKSKHPAKFTPHEIKDMIVLYRTRCKELEK